MLQLQYNKLYSAYNNKAIHNSVWQIGLPIVCIVAILLADRTSLLSYGYILILALLSSRLLCKGETKDLLFVYHFLLLFAITFYVIFKNQFPLYLGMTGPEGGIGTDDCRFYAQIVDGNVPYPVQVSLIDIKPYSLFLTYFYPFKVFTPLNIVTSSLIFTAYLPIYVRRLAALLTNDKVVGYYAFWYSLLCPFTIYFGCIIMRDLFTATLVVAGLCYFLEKKYWALLVCIIAIVWVRFGTFAFLAGGLIVLFRFRNKKESGSDFLFILLLVALIIGFYFAFSFLQEFSGGKLEDGIIRSTDSERYEGSTIAAILNLPFPLNIIISTVFFFYVPLLSIPHFVYGHYLVSSFFQELFTPLFMCFLWKYIYNAIFCSFSKKNMNVQTIFLIVIVFAFLLGSISMQSRHKTVLFPIMCILAAYGKVNYDKKYSSSSGTLTFLTIAVQIVLALRALV